MPYRDYTGQLTDLLGELQSISGELDQQRVQLQQLQIRIDLYGLGLLCCMAAVIIVMAVLWMDRRDK